MQVSDAIAPDTYLNHLLEQSQGQLISLQSQEVAAWVQARRGEAYAWVNESRMPTRKDEEWRFTDLSPLMEQRFQSPAKLSIAPESVEALVVPEARSSRLVFVNGVYAPELSDTTGLPKGVFVGNLAGLDAEQLSHLPKYFTQLEGGQELFTALNTAGLADAAVVWADPNTIVETPIHLLFLSVSEDAPALSQPRALIVAGASTSLEIIEHYASPFAGSYFTNAVTEIWLDSNAQLKHTRVQGEAESGFHIGKSAISQARDSRYTCNAISVGAKLSRHNLDAFLVGEQTDTRLYGLTLARGEQLSDTHSAIHFRHPYGTSEQLHKCILSDRARAVFNGKIFVPKLAQQTNATQLNRNLLLSPKAHVDTKPQLQITADNVKCSHGATVSQLEADEIFYLRSRGLNEADARGLLVDAFAGEILDHIQVDSVRERLKALVI